MINHGDHVEHDDHDDLGDNWNKNDHHYHISYKY